MAMKIDRIQPAGMNIRTQQGKPAYSTLLAAAFACSRPLPMATRTVADYAFQNPPTY
jgi:hypothetical protein